MRYEIFLQTIKEDLEKRLGSDYQVTLRSIPKNNGVIWDGVSICPKEEDIAPTIYLQDFYRELEGGQTLSHICDRIYQLYLILVGVLVSGISLGSKMRLLVFLWGNSPLQLL